MRGRLLPVLVLLSGCGNATAASYPIVQVLELAKATCAKLDSVDTVGQSALAQGWAEFTPPAGSPIATMTEQDREMDRSLGVRNRTSRYFRRQFKGEALELKVSRVDFANKVVTGCYLHDYGEDRLFDPVAVKNWVGRPPFKSEILSDARILDWEPGLTGQRSFGVMQVVPGVKDAPFDGIMIILDNEASDTPA